MGKVNTFFRNFQNIPSFMQSHAIPSCYCKQLAQARKRFYHPSFENRHLNSVLFRIIFCIFAT